MNSFQYYFGFIISTTFILLGVTGNLMSIAIFLNNVFRNQHTARYLIISCLANIAIIVNLPFSMLPSIAWQITDLNCKLVYAYELSVVEIHAWILATSSCDRLISVIKPYRYVFKKKTKFQAFIIILLVVFVVAQIAPIIWSIEAFNDSDNKTACLLSDREADLWVVVYGKFHFLFLRLVLPFGLMIISSAFIIWNLCRNRNKFLKIADYQREIELAQSLLFMDISFFIFSLPITLYILFAPRLTETMLLSYRFCFAFGKFYSVMTFFVFILTNKTFREILRKYLCCWLRKKKKYNENIILSSI